MVIVQRPGGEEAKLLMMACRPCAWLLAPWTYLLHPVLGGLVQQCALDHPEGLGGALQVDRVSRAPAQTRKWDTA
jgi:hypothetical protein